MLKLAIDDIEERRPVWLALSDLFLDTELQPYNFAYIARTINESPYSVEESETILFREVYPACIFNSRCVAGEWAGFDSEWLEQRILRFIGRGWTLSRVFQPRRWMIQDEWDQVKRLISATSRTNGKIPESCVPNRDSAGIREHK